jgi:sugar O-acyltransferase (sialic acid O-acetyltransferase NeuD family)
VILFGTGDLARLAAAHLADDSRHEVVAFTADAAPEIGTDTFQGLPFVAFERLAETFPPHGVEVFVAVGYRRVNRARAEVYRRVKEAGYRLLTYVSPHAIVAPGVDLGDNCFVFEGAILQAAVRIGSDTIVRAGAVIGHDTSIGEHCFIAPRASISGSTVIGDYTFVGNNATVRDRITVAPHTVIGAGALIAGDTRPGEIYVPERTRAAAGRTSSELDDL